MEKKTTEWHIIDHLRTDEDVHALLAAEREPYEKALRVALVVMKEIGDMSDKEIVTNDPRYYAKRYANLIVKQLAKEGISDPSELKDEENETH